MKWWNAKEARSRPEPLREKQQLTRARGDVKPLPSPADGERPALIRRDRPLDLNDMHGAC
jgi:hypothetical protein